MIPTSFLQDLKNKGFLPLMYRYGMINYKYAVMLEVRMKIDALMRQGRGKEDAVRMLIRELRVSRSTIYRYL